jgi:hypothetical protein
MHCPEPVTWRGSWRAPSGRHYRVEACEGHRPPPTEAAIRNRKVAGWEYRSASLW